MFFAFSQLKPAHLEQSSRLNGFHLAAHILVAAIGRAVTMEVACPLFVQSI